MKYTFFLFIGILFVGCTNTVAPKIEYRINPQVETISFMKKGCKDKSLKVAQAFSSNTLLSQDMSYGLGDSTQYVYSAALWSRSPNRAITTELLAVVRDSKLFKNVLISKSRSRSDMILEVNIEDFMQYFSKDSTQSYSNVVLNLSLIDARSNSVFSSQTFKVRVNVDALNSRGGVKGLNNALSTALMQSTVWLSEVCK